MELYDTETPKRQRRLALMMPILIVAVFAIPFLYVWYLYDKHHPWIHADRDQGEELIAPFSFEQLALRDLQGNRFDIAHFAGKWWLVYTEPHHCNHRCLINIHNMVKMAEALGDDQEKVGRVIVSNSAEKIQLIKTLLASLPQGTELALGDKESEPLKTHAFYIADPSGQLKIRYQYHANAHGILKKLRYLIRNPPPRAQNEVTA